MQSIDGAGEQASRRTNNGLDEGRKVVCKPRWGCLGVYVVVVRV